MQPNERDDLDELWQANERRLNELHAMTPLGREMNGADLERLEGEQDRIEWQLGFDHPSDSRTRRWSRMR